MQRIEQRCLSTAQWPRLLLQAEVGATGGCTPNLARVCDLLMNVRDIMGDLYRIGAVSKTHKALAGSAGLNARDVVSTYRNEALTNLL